MNTQRFKGFLRLNKLMVIPGGIWEPKISKTYLFFYKIYKIFVAIFVFIWYVLSEYLSILDTYNDFFETSSTLNITATHLGGTVKCFVFMLRSDEIRGIINKLENDNNEYEKTEGFEPEEIISTYKTWGKVVTISFYGFATSYFLLTYLPYAFEYVKIVIANGEPLTTTPYTLWMPFKHDTLLKYAATLLYQGLPFFPFIHVVIGSDALLINVMNLIACHLAVLQGAFRSIKERCLLQLRLKSFKKLQEKGVIRNEMETLNDAMSEEFKKMIKHLQIVITCAERLESFQTFITLTQILVGTFIFCSCLLLLTLSTFGSNEFITYVFYMAAALFQLGIYCTFGNNITTQAEAIPNAIWESNWLDTTVPYKKMMILTMQRMQKPIVLTVGKFAPLTLNTFSTVFKLSYSVYAVFKTRV